MKYFNRLAVAVIMCGSMVANNCYIAMAKDSTTANIQVSTRDFFTQMIDVPYFKLELLQRYELYHFTKPELDAEAVVKAVNIGLDNPFYTNTQMVNNPDAITVLVNKYNYLPHDYVPYLIQLPEKYSTNKQSLHPEAAEALMNFFNDAAGNGIRLNAASGYRSYEVQKSLYNRYLSGSTQEKVDTYSARAGYSEHQTGLAVDISEYNGAYNRIGNMPQYAWIPENAPEYGFIVRYTDGGAAVTGYQSEPWHLRYLGVELAKAVHTSGLTYDEFYIKYLENNIPIIENTAHDIPTVEANQPVTEANPQAEILEEDEIITPSAVINGNKVFIPWTFNIYDKPDFRSEVMGKFSPQFATIVSYGENGWVLIQTGKGDFWANFVTNSFYISHGFWSYENISKKSNPKFHEAQLVRVVGEFENGFVKIKTDEGYRYTSLLKN